MRWLLRSLGIIAAVIVAGLGYLVYTTVWGKPLWFNGLLDRQAAIVVLHQPELLTQIGIFDGGWLDFTSDKLGAYSLDERRAQYDQIRRFKAEILQWDRAKLSLQEQLSYDILLWSYDRSLADEKYVWLGADNELYPVNQAFGVQKYLPNFLLSDNSIANARSARNYVARLKAMGPLLDALEADVARQAKLGVIPPDFIIDDSIVQMKSLIELPPAKNALVMNLAEKTAKIGLDEGARIELVDEATAAVRNIVYPAYRGLIAEERALRQHAGHDAGLWRLRGGNAYYADQLKLLTSTDMTPDEIHNYGLKEVARISAQMDTILNSIGLEKGSVGARMDRLMADPRFLYKNTDDGRRHMLARYKQLLDHVKTLLPRYFAHVPTTELDVRRLPLFAEKSSAGAYYDSPSFDGKRPGVFLANLRNVGETPMWAMPTLAYHEGIPGHHMQIATAMEIGGLPLIRRLQYLPAFGEGWALYSEHLAKDIGLYDQDPYGDLGRLQAELFRATRLVVDTGMHAKHWSREQAIHYMQSKTGMAPSEVTAEIERYVVWPGQACAYTIGMKVILSLREQAMAALGPRFKLKEFHAQVIENGAMPLWLLQEKLERWIAQKKGISPKS